MTTPEALKSTITRVEDLQSVVKTMKALAAVSIRQYQQAVQSLADYNRSVEMGLQIALKHQYFEGDDFGEFLGNFNPKTARLGAIIFGSDQGLCGQFNEQIAERAIAYFHENDGTIDRLSIAAVGARVVPPIQASKYEIDALFSVPSSAKEITPMVQELILNIEQWREQGEIDRVVLFYNHSVSGSSYESRVFPLLPVDSQWLSNLQNKDWPGNVMPTLTMDWQLLFSALIRQYLFVSLYRAFAESLASENASRLSSMQAAEKNINERLDDLTGQYRRQRQSSITGELLDIAAGFEALTDR